MCACSVTSGGPRSIGGICPLCGRRREEKPKGGGSSSSGGGGGRDIEGRKGNKKKKKEEGRVGSASTPPVGSENK